MTAQVWHCLTSPLSESSIELAPKRLRVATAIGSAGEMVLADASSAAMQQRPSPHLALTADLLLDPLWRAWLMPLARRDGTQHNTCFGLGQQGKAFTSQGADQLRVGMPAQAEDQLPPANVIRA